MVEVGHRAAEVDDVAAHHNVVLNWVLFMLCPVQLVHWAQQLVFVHVPLDVFDHVGVVVSDVHLRALSPFLGRQTRHPHPSAQLQHSLTLEQQCILNHVPGEDNAGLPEPQSVKAVREGVHPTNVQGHLEVVVDDDLFGFALEHEFIIDGSTLVAH